MKTCKTCKEEKTSDSFYTRWAQCKECYSKEKKSQRELVSLPKKMAKAARVDKQCTVCMIVKDLSMFYKHSGTLDGRNSHCKSCMSNRHKTVRTPYRNNRRREIKQECLSMLGGACSSCGLIPSSTWPIECFDFHHLSGKEFLISKLIQKAVAPEHMSKLLEEVSKCSVLCSNCHRRLHAASFIASE